MVAQPSIASANTVIDESQFDAWMHRLITPTKVMHLACAVSGGADSTALLYLTHRWLKPHEGRVTALIVDHGLRAESAAEAEKTQRYLQRLGYNAIIIPWQHEGAIDGNTQHQARQARYRLMHHWCLTNGVKTLLLGHHADDQAETLLLRLKRGSHIRGLAGMSARNQYRDLTLLRPLLRCTKTQLIATLHHNGLHWVEDPSNAEGTYERNQLRQQLHTLENEVEIRHQLCLTANRLATLRQQQERRQNDFIQRHIKITPLGYLKISHPDLAALDPPERASLLQSCLHFISGAVHVPRFSETLQLAHKVTDNAFKAATLSGCIVRKSAKQKDPTLYILREPAAVSLPEIEWLTPDTLLFDHRFLCHLTLATSKKLAQRELQWAALSREGKNELLSHLPAKAAGEHPGEAWESLPCLADLEKRLHLPHMASTDWPVVPGGFKVEFSPVKPLAAEPFFSL